MSSGEHTDPRLTDEYVERIDGGQDSGEIILVGVVHDHPSSIHRASTLVASEEPAVLGLELPPLAVPLFKAYASDGRSPESIGGEMNAAIQRATTDQIEGIDGPSLGFLSSMLGLLVRQRPSYRTITSLVQSTYAAVVDAVAHRLAAHASSWSALSIAIGSTTAYEVCRHDDPTQQATDEQTHVRKANAVLDAFEQPPTAKLRTEAREQHMADRLADLATDGDVVAIVGIAHLEPLSKRLRS